MRAPTPPAEEPPAAEAAETSLAREEPPRRRRRADPLTERIGRVDPQAGELTALLRERLALPGIVARRDRRGAVGGDRPRRRAC